MLELRDGSCYPKEVVGVDMGLACVDGVIAIIAFYQMLRIHSRNSHLGWTREKVFHLLIGTSNFGYLLYFALTPVAACKDWLCWSQSCGFIIMALPKILFVAAFLLLLSFWVDLCHQTNDEEDEGCSPGEALLEKIGKTDYGASSCSNCCTFSLTEVGSRQKVVILVTVLVTAIMVASSLLIWIGMGKNPIDSIVVAQAYLSLSLSLWESRIDKWRFVNIVQVYVYLIAISVLLLGIALASYGLVLFLKMRKVRSERSSSETWKVAGLAVVCFFCFTSSASVALATNIPLLYHWHGQQMDGVYTALLEFLYYFIGSSVPSAFVLFEMRELPPPLTIDEQEQSRTLAFISDGSVTTHPQRWITSTIVQNQVSRASPI